MSESPSTVSSPHGDGFADLGLEPALVGALEALGYRAPTPIQRAAVPVVLAGGDVLGQAATGTGKTAAFALPVLQRVVRPGRGDRPGALVLVPTRELAVQVAEAFRRYGRPVGARVAPVYGGQPIGRQLQALAGGLDVVVATPGRALDHLRRGTLSLAATEVVVLDEADEMLDMGFADDLDALLAAAPSSRQTLLFSATMPPRLDAIVRRHLRDPQRVVVDRAPGAQGTTPRVRQLAHVVGRAHRAAALARVLDVEDPAAALVFCRTRSEVDELTELLNARGHRAEALHGGIGQEQRDRVLARLRSGASRLLVATDVAARGLDIDVLTHVVNHDVPSSPEAYVHRIGRVGRAGREGTAVTICDPRQQRLLHLFERATGAPVTVAPVPSVAQLREARRVRTAAALRALIEDADRSGDGTVTSAAGDVAPVVAELAEEYGLEAVARAAVTAVHRTLAGPDDLVEIPDASVERPRREGADRGAGGGAARPGPRAATAGHGAKERPPVHRSAGSSTARVHLNIGRHAGVRPQDLVGAITGEAGLRGGDIGAIRISDRYSVVEVPERHADAVVRAMRGALVRGRKVAVRRWTDTGRD